MTPTEKHAIGVMALSALVLLSGNVFLSGVGLITGSLGFSFAGRSPDLIIILCFLTATLTLLHLFTALPLGILLVSVDPATVCHHLSGLVSKLEQTWASVEEADQGSLAGGARDSYTGKGMYSSIGSHQIEELHDRVCGEHGRSLLLAAGTLVLLFSFFVIFPLLLYTMRLLAAARRAAAAALNSAAFGAFSIVAGEPPAYPARAGPHIPVARPIVQPNLVTVAAVAPATGARPAAAPTKEMH